MPAVVIVTESLWSHAIRLFARLPAMGLIAALCGFYTAALNIELLTFLLGGDESHTHAEREYHPVTLAYAFLLLLLGRPAILYMIILCLWQQQQPRQSIVQVVRLRSMSRPLRFSQLINSCNHCIYVVQAILFSHCYSAIIPTYKGIFCRSGSHIWGGRCRPVSGCLWPSV